MILAGQTSGAEKNETKKRILLQEGQLRGQGLRVTAVSRLTEPRGVELQIVEPELVQRLLSPFDSGAQFNFYTSKILPAFVLVALHSVRPVSASSFYVSSSLGSDSNDGSQAFPWRSLARAFRSPLAPGDAILLRQGDTWELAATLNATGVQGAASAPIAFSAYADATSSEDRPVVARSTGGDESGILFNFHNGRGLNISGIEFVGAEVGLGFTFDALASPPPSRGYANYTIEDCVFRAQTGAHYNASTGSWWGSAIAFAREGTVGVTASSIRIAHCIFTECDQAYTNNLPTPTFPDNLWTRAYIDGLDFAENAMVADSYNVLFLDTTTAVSVRDNVFLRDTPPQLFVAGTTDIIMGSLDATCSITGNEISWRGEYNATDGEGPDGCAIDFETSAVGTVVSGNYISHSWGAGIMVFGHTVGSKNISLVDNILAFDGCEQKRSDHGGIAFMRTGIGASGRVDGNVIKTCPGIPAFFVSEQGADAGFTFTNNTIDDGSNGSATVSVMLPPVVTRVSGASPIVLRAAAQTGGDVLRYSIDGSRPTPGSPLWPGGSGGTLELPPRTVAVFVKAFPPPGAAAGGASALAVESPVAGGVYTPSPAPPES